jgi:septum site-determining protein MinD
LDSETQAGQAYNDAVDRLLGSELPHRFLEAEKKSFLARLLGGK